MQIYCPIFLDLERKQYICTQQFTESMVRIHLTKREKQTLRDINDDRGIQNIPIYVLHNLQEKGLVTYIANHNEVVDAKLTLYGRYYIEQNPKLKNPTLWEYIYDFITENKEQTTQFLIILSAILNIALVIKIMMMS